MGKLLKGGDPDLNTAAKKVITDWLRGRLPYFELPEESPAAEGKAEARDTPDVPEGIKAMRQDMHELEPHVEAAAAEVQKRAGLDEDDLSDDDAEAELAAGADDGGPEGSADGGEGSGEEEGEEADAEARGAPAEPVDHTSIKWEDVFDDDDDD
mmetsp:Transcript_11058/g.37638  ORF Transcript_11058/g.37638 Transcript_11058/m.37638 type:complete len:154 (-) Transcript_11058:91-552(-)